jgi:hypothetical protein
MTRGCIHANDNPSDWALIQRWSTGANDAQSYPFTNFGRCKLLCYIYEQSTDYFLFSIFIVPQFFSYYLRSSFFVRHDILNPIEGDDWTMVNIIAAAAGNNDSPT